MRAVSLVSSLVSPPLAEEFSHELRRLASPDSIARKLVADILTDDNDGQMATVPNFTQELSTRLQQISLSLYLCLQIIKHKTQKSFVSDKCYFLK